ncbi:MAG: hypothetical protein H6703_00055 [Myxococcales bacterium]|nr:hypothetical protein [Myxococcales bacterium]
MRVVGIRPQRATFGVRMPRRLGAAGRSGTTGMVGGRRFDGEPARGGAIGRGDLRRDTGGRVPAEREVVGRAADRGEHRVVGERGVDRGLVDRRGGLCGRIRPFTGRTGSES